MLNKVIKKCRQPAILPATFSVAPATVCRLKKKEEERKHKEKRKVLNLLKPRMKCLILWSNDKEKKMQQNKNQKYSSVLYFGTLLNDFHKM